jgi:hypothetical protein
MRQTSSATLISSASTDSGHAHHSMLCCDFDTSHLTNSWRNQRNVHRADDRPFGWSYLENVRGRIGGFRSAKSASQITIGEVVRLTEDTLELVEFLNPETNSCPLMRMC